MNRRPEAALLLGELDAGHSAAAQLGKRCEDDPRQGPSCPGRIRSADSGSALDH